LLGRGDVRRIGPIAVTCPARTLVDLAATVQVRQLEAAVDRALTRGISSLAAVDRYIADRRLAHRPGVGRLRRLIADRTEGVPSEELEREFLRLVRRVRLPKPVRQQPQGRFRIDFAYPDLLIAIEVDGWNSHGTPAALAADLKRQNALVLRGWTILRFTWRQLIDMPDDVAATIRTALRGVPRRV
jgi:very-short-patch-repair endonuclease